MIPNTLKAVAAVALVAGLAFWVGLLMRPGDDETPAALVALRDSIATMREQSVADSIALARTRDGTDAAEVAAARALRRAAAADAKSKAYADTVRLLNDSLAVTISPAGEVDTSAIPPAIANRLRADSATIADQADAIDSLKAIADSAHNERAASDSALASANRELGALRRQIPLERASEYARGKRDGTRKGIVIGSLGTFTIVFTGVKVIQATRLQHF